MAISLANLEQPGCETPKIAREDRALTRP